MTYPRLLKVRIATTELGHPIALLPAPKGTKYCQTAMSTRTGQFIYSQGLDQVQANFDMAADDQLTIT